MSDVHTGQCLCGRIRFRVEGPLRAVVACHCSQCRRQSGHFYAATNADDAALTVSGSQALTWYRASGTARRGFCATCGSALFWKHDGESTTSILAGAFDKPSGLTLKHHIFCADKGDYYAIADGLPRFEGDDGSLRAPKN